MEYEFKGTPGPWVYVRDCGIQGGDFSIENNTQFYVAETIGGLNDNREEANAALLAAAPDLLAALIAAVDNPDGGHLPECDREPWFKAAKEAIHKALNLPPHA